METYKIDKEAHIAAAVSTSEMKALTVSVNGPGLQLKLGLQARAPLSFCAHDARA